MAINIRTKKLENWILLKNAFGCEKTKMYCWHQELNVVGSSLAASFRRLSVSLDSAFISLCYSPDHATIYYRGSYNFLVHLRLHF